MPRGRCLHVQGECFCSFLASPSKLDSPFAESPIDLKCDHPRLRSFWAHEGLRVSNGWDITAWGICF